LLKLAIPSFSKILGLKENHMPFVGETNSHHCKN